MPALLGIALWALLPGYIAMKKGRHFWAYYFLSFLITPLLTFLITIFLKNLTPTEVQSMPDTGSTTFCQMTPSSQMTDTDTTPSMQAMQKIRFCGQCGFELFEESKYCSQCGAKIKKEV